MHRLMETKVGPAARLPAGAASPITRQMIRTAQLVRTKNAGKPVRRMRGRHRGRRDWTCRARSSRIESDASVCDDPHFGPAEFPIGGVDGSQ